MKVGARDDREPGEDRFDAFISYSRKDQAFVEDVLRPALEDHDLRLWIDLRRIPPGASFDKRLAMGVEASRAFVPVLSPDWARSKMCAQELEHAVALKKRLLPVVYRD